MSNKEKKRKMFVVYSNEGFRQGAFNYDDQGRADAEEYTETLNNQQQDDNFYIEED